MASNADNTNVFFYLYHKCTTCDGSFVIQRTLEVVTGF